MEDFIPYRRPSKVGVESFAPTKMHKAGLFIVGDVEKDGKNTLHVIAPWVEGAYSSDKHKAPTLSKGSIELKRHQPTLEPDSSLSKQRKAELIEQYKRIEAEVAEPKGRAGIEAEVAEPKGRAGIEAEVAEPKGRAGIEAEVAELKGKTKEQRKRLREDKINRATLWNAAVDETFQETGIDLRRIKNPGYPDKEPPEGQEFYPDVEIDTILANPAFIGELPSNRGFAKNHMMFMVKVKGIEHLEPHLKHRDNNKNMDSPTVSKSAKKVAKEADFYMFKDLLPIFRTGEWTIPLEERELKGEEKIYKSSFCDIEKEYAALKGIQKPEEFRVKNAKQMDDLFATVSEESKRTIKDYLGLLRDFMAGHQLVNDNKGLKLGDKHLPLRYYQEGADIIPMDAWIKRMVDMAHVSERYRDTQFNPNILHVELTKRDKVIEVADPCMSMAKMVYKVATSIDKAREIRQVNVQENRRGVPDETWPSTVIEANSTLLDDIRGLELEVDAKYDHGNGRVVTAL